MVVDDDGHTLYRGERMAVCDKTYQIYTDLSGPYGGDVIGIKPHEEIPVEAAQPFDCRKNTRRDARTTKGQNYSETILSDQSCCGPEGC